MSEQIAHCNLKSNADLIARILDYDIERKEYRAIGEWKEWWSGDCALILTGEEKLWMCSACESKQSKKSNFCPWCGADMREKAND